MNSRNPLNIMAPWRQTLVAGYYAATLPYRKYAMRRYCAARRAPVVSLFYHRIAEDKASPWTQSFETFSAQMHWLKQHFDLVSLEEAQRRLREGNSRPAVHITFDDGYADNCNQAIPFLLAENIPCTYFVTTRFVSEGLAFPHDVQRGKRLAVNTVAQLREMTAAGIEIAAHTRTHADLGKIQDRGRLQDEVIAAGEELQQLVGQTIRYFAFPYGLPQNLNADVFHLAYEAGYEAVCSAYGGYNFPGDDAFHIQRIPVEDSLVPLINRVTLDPRKLWSPYRYEYQPTTLANEPEKVAIP